jgi:transcriptional regulator with XRE-family HTH domain
MEDLRIKSILKKKGMTMNDLALKLGINRVSLSVAIKRDGNPQLNTLKRISDILGVELYELFERKEKGDPDISGYLEVKGKGIFKIGCFEDLERIYHELK